MDHIILVGILKKSTNKHYNFSIPTEYLLFIIKNGLFQKI